MEFGENDVQSACVRDPCRQVNIGAAPAKFVATADTRKVMMFTSPTNPRVTLEVYNIFMMDCRDDDRLAGK
jgi:hypothetical protein